MTGPEHYQMAESLTGAAAGVMDYKHGIYASMGTQERLQRRAALTAEAQVHATLALVLASAYAYPASEWHKVAGTEVTP